ncbi:MAG TPA: hypothetical protein ENO20_06320 [Bacteroides sp.]|nr:hypothetical protein [Bacteroides sp.]
MGWILHHITGSRTFRHITFWLCWVMGFTFIQSFGQPVEVYFGWFSYYVLTLPVFVGHTYLVVYVLMPRFLNRRLFPLFVVFFLLLFYGFSVLELVLSHEFIFRWYPTGSEVRTGYLAPGNVVISGLGNLYILLVFLACKITRNWYLADNKKKRLQQEQLQQRIEDTITRVQPAMLLYAMDHIERMLDHSPKNVTTAVALTSELLHEVMTCYGEKPRPIVREIGLVRKFVSLVSLFRDNEPEVEFFLSGDQDNLRLPPLILFSFLDIFFRRFDENHTLPEINIEASGFSRMVTIQVLDNGSRGFAESLESLMHSFSQLENSFENTISISCETSGYGGSVIITEKSTVEAGDLKGKAFDPLSAAVHRMET